ncbi:MAG: CDP-diacylglycerol--glycerol-3-phosphate 3-phosphatidyltransferase [Eubacteriales bacterium]|nr:CDP-diacylglycerol--glycerol-3-phosphate 3-phosphatidyltransferase [Sarcina sp.]MBR2729403.1 CDP-diacylglycerol--glycerol-3-phosphate 3-phosphatidyltransferase [Lachnospiraceae bacterium]MDO4418201.1 CDP-diacylglycerol--glycerol-3-phosphate 3-phosphatidyltransferase [Eubacteriales bacterium]
MNLPNKLTVFRVALVPFFVAFLLLSREMVSLKWVALVLFVTASLTDLLDGHIARKYGLVTTFGKFMDPLADKVLTISGMICLIELGRIPSWIVVIIVAREFVISGFRLIATEHGIVIAANYWGKWKTTFQMIMIILMIMNLAPLGLLTDIVMWVALILTVISLATYILENREVVQAMEMK